MTEQNNILKRPSLHNKFQRKGKRKPEVITGTEIKVPAYLVPGVLFTTHQRRKQIYGKTEPQYQKGYAPKTNTPEAKRRHKPWVLALLYCSNSRSKAHKAVFLFRLKESGERRGRDVRTIDVASVSDRNRVYGRILRPRTAWYRVCVLPLSTRRQPAQPVSVPILQSS